MNTSIIGIVELPEFGLLDSEGRNWLGHTYKDTVLISKQVLLSNLQGAGFDARLVNLLDGDDRVEYGRASWGDAEFAKVYIGKNLEDVDATAYDAWGVTNNFSQNREIAVLVIKHLASRGRPVVAGGSDAIAASSAYLAAGASAVVLDKSGAANAPIMDHVLGRTPREELAGVTLADGNQPPPRVRRPFHPEDWPLPELSVVKQCLGLHFKGLPLPEDPWPMGSIFTDIGCDRTCDFCQTPKYRLGYRAMSPGRVLQWAELQKEAGAKAVMLSSDQFLARLLKKGGRKDILEIMENIRALGLSWFWNNGIELKKMTLGRGINRKSGENLIPDEELIAALCGWDGKAGCYFAYIPAERPVVGQENYKKLLPWREHCEMMKAIVRIGIPYLRYGIIIGFADDSHENLSRLEEAARDLYEELVTINPSSNFQVAPLSLSPIPGTPQSEQVRQSGLLRFDDPSILGSVWAPSMDTHHLNYKEVFEWQKRLSQVGESRYMEDGITLPMGQ
uniref:Radical SAM core domain-containing protein n=1 Tax=Candidatus Kentrum sp. SD TaxID=2126332 RepID=A0A450Y7Q5_9GAMM|nr:MAG: hypothetical protein BECKSD772F_GA0070984_101642 [Candidatus Kentron sp. SD]VFK43283.1 MAG: hypothetical protein BECKSD772E_GA0070983_10244 [Candidatus Kentron sp. SD]VFK80442.1 MAG: hypothetical protein BECKSD772D_GA0070982_11155 [Candidatus Kentron sp. SD]